MRRSDSKTFTHGTRRWDWGPRGAGMTELYIRAMDAINEARDHLGFDRRCDRLRRPIVHVCAPLRSHHAWLPPTGLVDGCSQPGCVCMA